MQGLVEGRIVHYVVYVKQGKPVKRPAIVVNVLDKKKGICNLQVFLDLSDSGCPSKPVGCLYSEKNEVGTWQWVPKD